MSRWLKSVNNLLETLDGKAETVAETVADAGTNPPGVGDFFAQDGDEYADNYNDEEDEYLEEEEEDGDIEFEGYNDEYHEGDLEEDNSQWSEEILDDEMQQSYDEEIIEEDDDLQSEDPDAPFLTSDDEQNSRIGLEEALEAPTDSDEAISVSLRRGRTDSGGEVTVSDISQSEISEGDDMVPDPENSNTVSTLPSIDAPPKTPNRYISRPEDVLQMATTAASQHNPETVQEVSPQTTSNNTSSKPPPPPPGPPPLETNKSLSPKLMDASPRPPRRSTDGKSLLPKDFPAPLDEDDDIDAATNDNNSVHASDNGNAATVTAGSNPSMANDAESAQISSSHKRAPRLPARKASYKNSIDENYAPFKKKIQSLQSQVNASQSQLQTKQTQIQALQKQMQAMESKLEVANAEIHAQSEELRRAGERMEKDRVRAQEERQDLMDDQEDEIDQIQANHQAELDQLRNQYESQMAELTQQLEKEETLRRVEGGDLSQELQDALQRERDALKQLNQVKLESSNLQSTITKLQNQQSNLQTKLDTALASVQTATEREREADDKLDAALSLHARQLSQRQAREAELEQTILELGSALTVARQKTVPAAPKASSNDEQELALSDKYTAVVDELETLKVQYQMETQRREALQEELNDISKERTEELSTAQAKQRQYDRRVADLESTVARLHQQQKEQVQEKASEEDRRSAAELGQELRNTQQEVERLSSQLLRQQQLAENSKSEVLALKGRLQAATTRAEQAEQSLYSSQTSSVPSTPTNRLYQMEAGNATIPSSARRRIKGGAARGKTRSIRVALQLHPGQTNPFMEQVAITLDALDSFMVETGAFMRHEPLARLAFLLYLMTLHLWSFALVVFHTTEQPHGDFGSMDNNPRHWREAAAAP
eukprot:Nitzschia sp. Nitz4//scaffold9_size221794//219273//221945//NITZ4_001390-RA/size221794-processed-gene-0.356-mRNA-1//-1//CDS//3329561133//7788//frame0